LAFSQRRKATALASHRRAQGSGVSKGLKSRWQRIEAKFSFQP
jgi:hypothetical protein